MKKKISGVVLLGSLGLLLFALRSGRVPSPDVPAADQERPEGAGRAANRPTGQLATHGTPTSSSPMRAANPVFPTATATEADEGTAAPSTGLRARDGFYDKLLAKQERDRAKEEQLSSRVMAAFGESPDTLVGSIACSTQFCRVDLRGVGKVDVRTRWQRDLFSAVEPKGLKFFIVDTDDDGNTLASCYFGRSESWTVPDFGALGML